MEVLIVDDEPMAQKILKAYVLRLTNLQLAGIANNALEAFAMIGRQHIDLVLLDINLPEVSGIELIRTLKNPPLVIFTTAYSEYAVESYELNAVDYLVKPIPFERFLQAIDKAVAVRKKVSTVATADEKPIMFVKTEGKLVSVNLDELWFVEGYKDYVRLWTESGRLVVLTTMQHMEEQLAGNPRFIRVSRSYIVNLRYIKEVDGNVITIKGNAIAIGNTYRSDVSQFLEQFKLV